MLVFSSFYSSLSLSVSEDSITLTFLVLRLGVGACLEDPSPLILLMILVFYIETPLAPSRGVVFRSTLADGILLLDTDKELLS